jgi:hypothetical protein
MAKQLLCGYNHAEKLGLPSSSSRGILFYVRNSFNDLEIYRQKNIQLNFKLSERYEQKKNKSSTDKLFLASYATKSIIKDRNKKKTEKIVMTMDTT